MSYHKKLQWAGSVHVARILTDLDRILRTVWGKWRSKMTEKSEGIQAEGIQAEFQTQQDTGAQMEEEIQVVEEEIKSEFQIELEEAQEQANQQLAVQHASQLTARAAARAKQKQQETQQVLLDALHRTGNAQAMLESAHGRERWRQQVECQQKAEVLSRHKAGRETARLQRRAKWQEKKATQKAKHWWGEEMM